jgi:hypothetical protein
MRKGSAPNTPNTGSQVFLRRKVIPKALSEGRECTIRVMKIAMRSAIVQSAEKLSSPKNILSGG